MSDKSPDAFRTISEVADDMDVPQHVLRFWETRFSQIKPLKRGGGRRYYRPDDVDLLRGLKRLLYGEGYTIKGVQRILKERGARHVIAIGRGAPVEPEARDAAVVSGAQPAPQHVAAQQPVLSPTEMASSAAMPSAPAARAMPAGAAPGLRLALSELSQARARLADLAGVGRADPTRPDDEVA